ncbi:hypothetical protein MTO96_024658 [Rhipicephalus appendiculatus]
MSTKPSRQGRTSITKEASRSERPAAAASDVEPDDAGHLIDRDLEKASRLGDFLRAARDVSKPPRLHRRQSITVPVPDKPNEANDLSSGSQRRGAVRRQQRTSEVVPPYSPDDRQPVMAPLIAASVTDATARVPQQPGEPRRSRAAGPATCSGTPSPASSMSRTVKEEAAVLTSDVDKALEAPLMTGGRTRTGGTHVKPLDEGPTRAPDNRSAVAVTSDTAPSHLEGTSEYRKDASEAGRRPLRASALRIQPCHTAVHFKSATLWFGTWQIGHPQKHANRGGQTARVADLCGTPDCIEHVHTLGIDTGRNTSPCQELGIFVCAGWSNDFRHVNASVTEQAVLHWIATVHKLSFGDFDQQAVINRPLNMMRQCMSGTTDEENAVRMLTAICK